MCSWNRRFVVPRPRKDGKGFLCALDTRTLDRNCWIAASFTVVRFPAAREFGAGRESSRCCRFRSPAGNGYWSFDPAPESNANLVVRQLADPDLFPILLCQHYVVVSSGCL